MNRQALQNDTLAESIDNGIHYLSEHQLANGEFTCYLSSDPTMQQWCAVDSNTFITSVVSNCLQPYSNKKEVEKILTKSRYFLRSQMMRGAVFHFYTIWHNGFQLAPPDVDCTCTAALFLKSVDTNFSDPKEMLLNNRNSKGLFYTWFAPRLEFTTHRETLRLRLRFLKYFPHSILHLFKSDYTYRDLDLIVNCNVLFYFGKQDFTKPIINYIIRSVKAHQETDKDSWYYNPIIAYQLLSRVFTLGIAELEDLKPVLTERIVAYIKLHQLSGLETAVGLTALLNLGFSGLLVQELATRLLEFQQPNGSWPRFFYYSTPNRKVGWGSEELSTGLALEALNHYQNHLQRASSTL